MEHILSSNQRAPNLWTRGSIQILEVKMERSPLKSVENTRREPAEKSYKKLYHELVERHSVLQSQLESYNNQFQKMDKIEQLKVLSTQLMILAGK